MNFSKAEFILSAVEPSKFLRDGLPQIAFAGRSNVGKSSVINRLLGRKNFAHVGATPGKTSQVNYFKLDGAAYLVDLPGYGYAKVSASEKLRWAELVEGYLNAGRNIRLVVQIVDFRHMPTQDDLHMIDFLVQAGLPFLIAATKSDKLNKTQRTQQLDAYCTLFEDLPDTLLIPFSAVNGEGVEEMRRQIELACMDSVQDS